MVTLLNIIYKSATCLPNPYVNEDIGLVIYFDIDLIIILIFTACNVLHVIFIVKANGMFVLSICLNKLEFILLKILTM